MGNKLCKQCETQGQPLSNNQPIGDLNDPDQPQRQYAYQQNVKYEVPCTINHIFTDIPEQKIPQNLERGKKFQNSYFLLPYSVYYTGQWKKGRPHGIGDIVFQNGSLLKGIFYQGQVKGQDCILIMEDGSYYRGEIQNNAFNGMGKFVQSNKHTYEGQWKNNAPHGKGVQIFANGDSYEGQYVEGKKKGLNGVYRWFNHLQFVDYVGEFSNDYMNGQGTIKKQNGSTISGIFREGIIEDAVIKSKQFQYKGEVKNGVLDGNGVLKFLQQNKVYEGKFKNGQPHGVGTIKLASGEKKSGNWFRGNLVTDYRGLSDDQVEKCLNMVQSQFESKVYAQDAVQAINFNLGSSGFKNYNAKLVDSSQASKIKADKYVVYDLGNKSLIITA